MKNLSRKWWKNWPSMQLFKYFSKKNIYESLFSRKNKKKVIFCIKMLVFLKFLFSQRIINKIIYSTFHFPTILSFSLWMLVAISWEWQAVAIHMGVCLSYVISYAPVVTNSFSYLDIWMCLHFDLLSNFFFFLEIKTKSLLWERKIFIEKKKFQIFISEFNFQFIIFFWKNSKKLNSEIEKS